MIRHRVAVHVLHSAPVSSKDVAALAGVAQSTVSYVMSGNRPISQKTRDKVEKAMRELGYVPDAHARAMISNRSYIIGLLTETTETTQGAELFPILRAIRATAKEHGYDLIRMSSTCTTEDLADMRRLGKGNLVDAFIMLDIRHHDGRLKSAMKLGLPIVPYGRPRRAVPLPLRGLRHEGDRGHGRSGRCTPSARRKR